MSELNSWKHFQESVCYIPQLGMSVDVSRVRLDSSFYSRMNGPVTQAFQDMAALERGAIANPDENRMVGHYWLRNPALAPTPEITAEIRDVVERIKSFAAAVHSGKITAPGGAKFSHILSIGIGGSALGPMFVADALGHPVRDKMLIKFIDNTDPDGIARTLDSLVGLLDRTLCIVISKSGSTPEPHNGMLLAAHAYEKAGLNFASHAVAVTMAGSVLDQTADKQHWLERFPMFDWVGGRTSEMSAVGMLPAALQGLDIDAFLGGAAACDDATRNPNTRANPAAMLALAWYHATDGHGKKDMVVLPYKDRLLLFSRYLQQLVMESLGKRLDLNGTRVDQGISVFGNKGSTDQHAYVQQLRDGVPNFFVVFVRVLESGGCGQRVGPDTTAGDYLHGFLIGTRAALFENDRESITITIPRVDERTIGALIALFERAVGLYANLIGINAYHQPGVEAGKKAAASVLQLQRKVIEALSSTPQSAEQIATRVGALEQTETVFMILEHLAANRRALASEFGPPAQATFRLLKSEGPSK